MKIIADENVFEPIIEFLKKEGFEVISIRDSRLSGITDEKIYKMAVDKEYVIVTIN